MMRMLFDAGLRETAGGDQPGKAAAEHHSINLIGQRRAFRDRLIGLEFEKRLEIAGNFNVLRKTFLPAPTVRLLPVFFAQGRKIDLGVAVGAQFIAN